eukprot:TRINITY_DN2867_c0_g1_i1.p1 TRINITY_DN2867_c0_g1~~TRINITY_DN2867_c0_g1_i1.p1  ORF type:complete len:1158 (-),score=297.25 TRINITY_DN2867_c0_g1_i1:42-3488(-)
MDDFYSAWGIQKSAPNDVEQPYTEIQTENLSILINEFVERLDSYSYSLSHSLDKLWESDTPLIETSIDGLNQISLFDTSKSTVTHLDKVFLTFSVLTTEINRLYDVYNNRFMNFLSVFGEPDCILADESEDVVEGMGELYISRSFARLRELQAFLRHLRGVLRSLILQLVIYHDSKGFSISIDGRTRSSSFFTSISTVFEAIARGLSLLLITDEFILQNAEFEAWKHFAGLIDMTARDSERFNIVIEQAMVQQRVVQQMDADMMEGHLFQQFLFEVKAEMYSTGFNKKHPLLNALDEYLGSKSAYLYTKCQQVCTMSYLEAVANVCLLFLGTSLSQSSDDLDISKSKLSGRLSVFLQIQTIQPLWHICGSTYFSLSVCLSRLSGENSFQESAGQVLFNKYKELDSLASTHISRFDLQTSQYLSRICSVNLKDLKCNDLVNLLKEGFELSIALKNHALLYIGLCTYLQKPMNLNSLLGIVRMFANADEVYIALKDRLHQINTSFGYHISVSVQQMITEVLLPYHERLNQAGKSTSQDIDLLDCVSALIVNLLKLNDLNSRSVLSMAYELIVSNDSLKGAERNLSKLFSNVKFMLDFSKKLKILGNQNHMFYIRNHFPTLFKHIWKQNDHKSSAFDLERVCRLISRSYSACKDGLYLGTVAETNELKLAKHYQEFVEEIINTEFITPLYLAIEDDLRIHASTALRIVIPTVHTAETATLNSFVHLNLPLPGDKTLSVQLAVLQKISQDIFDYTVSRQTQYYTYLYFEDLAYFKYGLKLIHSWLPAKTVDRGLDILEIMRKIHLFVKDYHYNLHCQFFIERISAEHRYVHTITNEQISSSIETHGSGIVSTAVYYVWTFLVNRLNIISQFLFDDYVRSPLKTEAAWFEQHRKSLDNVYPYVRAEELRKTIKKLGSHSNINLIDKFREVVTRIGNALGYLRMLRSGDLRSSALQLSFVRNFDQLPDLVEKAREDNLPQDTIQAVENLQELLVSLQETFTDSKDFLQIIVEGTGQTLANEQHKHLQYFYIFVPALLISHINFMNDETQKLMGTSKVVVSNSKRNITKGVITEDGFALGIAFLLRSLGLTEKFEGLHFFQAIKQYEEVKLAEQKRKAKDNQVFTRIQDLKMYQVNILKFTLNSCFLLFPEYEED